jgi:hypothetical protein
MNAFLSTVEEQLWQQGISDLDQGAGLAPSNYFNMDWQPISTAPFDRDLEVAVINYHGTHALAFPVGRILGSWINAKTKSGSRCTRRTGVAGNESPSGASASFWWVARRAWQALLPLRPTNEEAHAVLYRLVL